MKWISTILAITILALPAATTAQIRDQDRAQSAVRAGEVRPLSEILPRVRREEGDRVLDVDLNRGADDGRSTYTVRMMSKSGEVTDVTVDALTGDTIRVERGGN